MIAALLKSPITWIAIGVLVALSLYQHQGSQLRALRIQHAHTLQGIAEKTAAAERALRIYTQAVQRASSLQAQKTADHEKQTATQLDALDAAADRERTARLREQSALAGFITRHRQLAARAATPEQCAAASDQATGVLADLYRSERARRAAVGHHADELFLRLAGCTAWADDTEQIINAGPQGHGMTP